MVATQPLISQFTFVGKLEDIIINSKDCVKYLQLVTKQDKYWIKVTKDLRNSLDTLNKQLQPGCQLKVTGKRSYQLHKGEVQYKAYDIELLNQKQNQDAVESVSQQDRATVKPKAKVLFCQKSTCWKKGGKAACEALKTELKNRGLEDRVQIQTTGCLKQCKKAPNMVIMPDKARYSKVKSKQVAKLIDRHLLTKPH